MLRQALNAAVADRLLRVNPAVGQRMVPPQRLTERTVWNRDEVRRFLLATSDTPLGALWAVQLWTGLRPSESLALTWADLDLDSAEPQLRVMRTLYRPRADRRMWRLEAPKTERSRAPVPLLPQVVEALRRHRDRQAVEKVIADIGYAAHGFVFAGATGDRVRRQQALQRAIADLNIEICRYADANGTKPALLPVMRLYDCRHTCATLLLEAGVAMRVVQEILRHSTMMLTANPYSHVRPALAQQAMAPLSAYVVKGD